MKKLKAISAKLIVFCMILVLAQASVAGAAVSGLANSIRSLPDKLSQSDIDELAEALKNLPGEVRMAISTPNDFSVLVKKVGPAVVNISTERTAKMRPMPFPFGDDFEFFFPFGAPPNMQPQERKQTSLGSGFIISEDGYIVTNNHVIENADVVRVNFDPVDTGEVSFEAKVIGTDKETDLALLKIETDRKLPFIKFGDSDALEVGEWVVAIGNPLGLDHTVTAGIMSAKFRNIDSSSLVRFLQTDASINPGNSGGPLLNLKGEVIGINTAIAAQAQGIGFAIPSSLAEDIINTLKADTKVTRGWLGVSIQVVDAATAKALGLPKAQGALIGGVIPGQPAEQAGIEPGDVILKIDGTDTNSPEELQRTVMSKKPGQTVTAQIWRDGKTKNIKIKLVERGGAEQVAKDEAKPQSDNSSLGLQLRPVTEQEAARLRIPAGSGGLLITGLEPDKLAAKSGLNRGDVIMSVGRTPVKTVAEFNKQVDNMAKKQGAIALQINRNGNTFIRAIEMGK